MPQGRRKTPFSGKAKKEQLKAKKHTHSNIQKQSFSQAFFTRKPQQDGEEEDGSVIQKINFQPAGNSGIGRSNPNRYVLQFHKESNEEIRQRKELARHSLQKVVEKELEISVDEFFPKELDFPKRPTWSFDMSVAALEAKENRYFTEYLTNMEKQFNWSELSYFELNLETWRQLWRVLEMSDIILLIVDIRFPAAMFPPSLYDHVTKVLKKDMILVINKIDLVPAPLVVAWMHYFQKCYPELKVLMFTSFPGYNLVGKQSDKAGLKIRRRKGRLRMAAEGTQCLYDACKSIVGSDVDLSSWQQKIREEMNEEFDGDEDEEIEIGETVHLKAADTGFYEHEKYKQGILTIGCIGQPNVGKSSLLNAIMGKKVVSVSKTPGHTKHFQTIFLTSNVRLCDCPGLVFPSKVPKPIQILMGSFPIAQLREPFTTVKYLAERMDLIKLLRINHPEGDTEWSAMDICDGWAKQRGFITAKAARLDSYRAANSLLRMALDGKICLCLRPKGYSENKEVWQNHPDIEKVKWVQARSSADANDQFDVIASLAFSDDEPAQEASKTGNQKPKSKNAEESDSEEEDDEDDEVENEELDVKCNKFAALTVDD